MAITCVETVHVCTQEPPEAIRSHQKPSEAIRSHQEQSGAIRSHQEPSGAIRSHHLRGDGANEERCLGERSVHALHAAVLCLRAVLHALEKAREEEVVPGRRRKKAGEGGRRGGSSGRGGWWLRTW